MSKKIKVGIDINEILRARWLQFDRYFTQEFGEEEIPEQPYVYDLFKEYPWKEGLEVTKDLKEPDDMPEDINPLDYQVDKESGEAPADFAIFKLPTKEVLTPKEVYNRFMYQDFVFELHGSAPIMYRNMDLHVKNFYEKYKDTVEFVIISKENQLSIPSTLFFLSKMTSRFGNYRFCEDNMEMIDGLDVIITTDPDLLEYLRTDNYYDLPVPVDKKVVKLTRPYNENTQKGDITPVLQLNDLIENEEFEKLINYIKPQ